MKIKKSVICGVCPGACAVDVHLKDGKLIDIFPAEDDPYGRSEERRVAKECRSRWSPYHY